MLDLLAADALSAEPQQAAAALTTLCAVLAADPGAAAAEQLYRAALPARILGDLQEAPHRALTQARGRPSLLPRLPLLLLLLLLLLLGGLCRPCVIPLPCVHRLLSSLLHRECSPG